MLEVKNLQKSFISDDGSEISVVDVANFTLQSGEMIALHGESGSGKTTFLNLISGILPPDEGIVRFNGTCLNDLNESQKDRLRASSIGYVFQSFNLLQSCTALENLLVAMSFGTTMVESDACDMLCKVGLEERINHKPAELSLGQQQRVALARALINRPKLLLADEPTGNLDKKNTLNALNLMRELCAEFNTGLLMVSHESNVISSFEKQLSWSELNQKSNSNQ